jgi:hypothetical protein
VIAGAYALTYSGRIEESAVTCAADRPYYAIYSTRKEQLAWHTKATKRSKASGGCPSVRFVATGNINARKDGWIAAGALPDPADLYALPLHSPVLRQALDLGF